MSPSTVEARALWCAMKTLPASIESGPGVISCTYGNGDRRHISQDFIKGRPTSLFPSPPTIQLVPPACPPNHRTPVLCSQQFQGLKVFPELKVGPQGFSSNSKSSQVQASSVKTSRLHFSSSHSTSAAGLSAALARTTSASRSSVTAVSAVSKIISIPLVIEGGGAYGSMALPEPITSYVATGHFPDVELNLPWNLPRLSANQVLTFPGPLESRIPVDI
ncbi:hypothetical protein C8R47DRAFT_1062877 [Mycena vitilis]|nr:hypothetical protein C8R47DRAFT_1062877 [Mycena vitilis]